ncbi:transposase-like protein [Pseudoduganella flava]|uniref:Transposase-like protein n=2 Tax=Pseudoduganella flava TaxID=871742 RepID=A0A562PGT9_9BURK|nr:IS1595 family transposase [Pseudoduganella flava]TWI43553.1 transposase-like protein [Pseudoduganella flava]
MDKPMDPDKFERFLGRLRRQLEKLTRQQVGRTQDAVAAHAARWQCLDIIEAFGRLRKKCPHCGHRRFYRHGYTSGLQRYRCLGCTHTFSALTNTPLLHLRRRDRWLPYLQCMLDTRTVRASATVVGIHRNTSFRWRHRFLNRVVHDRPIPLKGIVEADETYLLESQKGSRCLNRPARRRGGVAHSRGISKEHDCILVLRDRGGQTRDWWTGRGRVTSKQLSWALPAALDQDVVLVTDGAKAYRTFIAAYPFAHVPLNLAAGIRSRGPYHLQNVNNYHSRFKTWLRTFLGVASHYLPNYLGWRHALDGGRITTPEGLLKSALGLRTTTAASH